MPGRAWNAAGLAHGATDGEVVMQFDLVIRGGSVVTPAGILEADIAVLDGKTAGLFVRGTAPKAKEIVDASGCHVLPGLIDIHCHYREPGYTERDDFFHASLCSAIGGSTTVFDMPNNDPPVTTGAHFMEKKSLASGRSHVDYGFWGAVAGDDLSHMEELIDCGVVGFKIFLSQTTGALSTPSDGALHAAFEKLKKAGRIASVHAEDRGYIDYVERHLKNAGQNDCTAFDRAHPNISESLAVARMAVLAGAAGNHLHIAHLSTAEGLSAIENARRSGVRVTCETCPPYTLLTRKDYDRYGQKLKILPPVRGEEDCREMLRGLADGRIDVVATDSAAHVLAEKLADRSIWDIPAGVNQSEHFLCAMLTHVNSGDMTLEQLVRAACETPARLFGLYPRKGVICPGADADYVIADLRKTVRVSAETTHYKQKHTIYEGWTFTGAPVRTILRGRTVVRDGEPVDAPSGAFLSPGN